MKLKKYVKLLNVLEQYSVEQIIVDDTLIVVSLLVAKKDYQEKKDIAINILRFVKN